MQQLKVATAQFENKSGDKTYNLHVIETLCEKAADEGARVVAFHECSITGYTFARHLSKDQLLEVAELIPGGESIDRLTQIAKKRILPYWQGFLKKIKKTTYTKRMYVWIAMDW